MRMSNILLIYNLHNRYLIQCKHANFFTHFVGMLIYWLSSHQIMNTRVSARFVY